MSGELADDMANKVIKPDGFRNHPVSKIKYILDGLKSIESLYYH